MSRNVKQIEKCISKIIFTFGVALIGLFVFPALRVSASNADSFTWNVQKVENKQMYYQAYPYNQATSLSLNFEVDGVYSTYKFSETMVGSLNVEYKPMNYTKVLAYKHSNSSLKYVSKELYYLKVCIVDNLGNQYELDTANGGSFTINDMTGITELSLRLKGPVFGATKFDEVPHQIYVYSGIEASEILMFRFDPVRTITDSEGIVWTIPDEVENPVIISMDDSSIWKGLIDATDIKCIYADNGRKALASENIKVVKTYNPDGSFKTNLNIDYYRENYSVPHYIDSNLVFNKFLYGTLPELVTEKLPDPVRTITDTEGTVWTIPDEVVNPVVISFEDSSVWKGLIDATDIKYINGTKGRKVLASENKKVVKTYNPDSSFYTNLNIDYYRENYTVPHYIDSNLVFDKFLYGTLSEMNVEKLPSTTPEPDESYEQISVLKSEYQSDINPYDPVELYDASYSDTDNNWFTTWQSEGRGFSVFSSRRTLEAVDGNNGFYQTHFDEIVSYPQTVFNAPSAPYDGHCVVSFPQGYAYKQATDGTIVYPNGGQDIASAHAIVEVTPYLLAQGKRYEISPFGCQFEFPVYEGESFSYIVCWEAHIRADVQGTAPTQVQFEFPYDTYDYTVSVWYYADKDKLYNESVEQTEELKKQTEELKTQTGELKTQTEESKKQTDALTNYENADKMDSDNEKLQGAINDYDEISNSLFETAGDGIGNFDVTSGLKFSSSLLAAIGFLSTVITNIILAMGDFSILYTVGVCLVLVCVLLGLYKYFGGDD